MAVNPTWSPNAPVTAQKVIIDANNNVQQWTAVDGTTGATAPNWSITIGGFTSDGTGGWTLVVLNPLLAPPVTGLAPLPLPVFVADADGLDPNAILNDMVSSFQNLAGRTLQPAQVERLLINLYAFRESLVRNQIQNTGLQSLLAFAQFPMIDYLGQLLGVLRLNAQGALTTIQFTLNAALTVPITIPAGTLVGTLDGQVAFATSAALTIAAGAMSGSVAATCSTPGTIGNGYAVGQVSVQLNPNVQISAVTNTTVTGGGASPETDAHLRQRIQLAPNTFSVAGPTGAYKAFALGADPAIIDVLVTSPVPGSVNVYILTGPITAQPASAPNNAGIANAALLAKTLAVLSADKVRPLTDTVAVLAVAEVDYTITGTVTLFSDADPVTTQSLVQNAAVQFAINLASRIQRDIVPEEIIAALTTSGIYRVVLTAPVFTPLTTGQWANCTAISLTFVAGTEHS
jgi:phage-related baseplate assembly protein